MSGRTEHGERPDLEERLAEVCGVVNAAQGRLVEVLAEVIEAGSWQVAGIRSVSHWVTWKCGVSPARARELVALATRRAELPATLAALSEGELSVDQAVVVARNAPGHVEAEAAGLARHSSVEQLRRVLGRYVFARPLSPTEADTDTDVHAPSGEPVALRLVSFGYDDDGSWSLRARLDPHEGARAEQALEAGRQECFAAAQHPEGPSACAADVSWADAFMAMIERSLSPAASVIPVRDRHLMLVHLETDEKGSPGAHLHLGPALPEVLRRQLGCDGRVRAVFERRGVAVSVGRALRIVPERTRVAVEDRDGGCRVPGCSVRRWLQVHHVRHWEDGGATDTPNLVALCARHHRLHHRHRLGIEGDADRLDGLVFTDEWGRPLPGCGSPAPPGSMEEGARRLGLDRAEWNHPSGERLDYRWVEFDEAV